MNKTILRELVKVAKTQQEILKKLAQDQMSSEETFVTGATGIANDMIDMPTKIEFSNKVLKVGGRAWKQGFDRKSFESMLRTVAFGQQYQIVYSGGL